MILAGPVIFPGGQWAAFATPESATQWVCSPCAGARRGLSAFEESNAGSKHQGPAAAAIRRRLAVESEWPPRAGRQKRSRQQDSPEPQATRNRAAPGAGGGWRRGGQP